MIQVTVYSRTDCHLCEQTLIDLQDLQQVFPHQLQVIDVDTHPELRKSYGFEVPVVEVGAFRLKAPISRHELAHTLQLVQAQADQRLDASGAITPSSVSTGQMKPTSDRFTSWFANHYMVVINLLVFVYLFLPFLAPLFMRIGIVTPARLIYRGYGLVCHQLAYRSVFLFGEQNIYPRAAANVNGYLTFSQATGMGEGSSVDEIYAARDFVGNELVGYKVALCQRDIAIYGGILLFGLVFALTGRRIPPLPWYLWLGIGIVPIGIDGLGQLFSQPPLNLLPFRESTPLWRFLTGFLFGITTAWFGLPLVEQTMADLRSMIQFKRESAN